MKAISKLLFKMQDFVLPSKLKSVWLELTHHRCYRLQSKSPADVSGSETMKSDSSCELVIWTHEIRELRSGLKTATPRPAPALAMISTFCLFLLKYWNKTHRHHLACQHLIQTNSICLVSMKSMVAVPGLGSDIVIWMLKLFISLPASSWLSNN